MSFLVRMDRWSAARGSFTEAEKAALNAAVAAETICPPGVTLDLAKLAPELQAKVRDELGGGR